jgi:hypothetical protein
MHNSIVKPLTYMLCFSLLLHGCYSYSILPKEELTRKPLSENDIIILLTDGSVIECGCYRHIFTKDRSDFIYGIGKWRHQFSAETQFRGIIERTFIDSIRKDEYGPLGSILCYLSGGTILSFTKGDYVKVTPDKPPGLWCTGILKHDGIESEFSGKIPNENIRAIKIKKSDYPKTLGLIVLATGCIVMAVIVTKFRIAPLGN